MQYPLGQPLCPQSTKPRHGALLGLILLLVGLLPSLALAQFGGGGPPLGGPPLGGPAPSVPTTVTVDVTTSATSSPGEPFTPPATNTPSPEAAALKKEANALKVIEDILPDSLKSKAPELLEKVRTGETKIEEIEGAMQLHALLLRGDLRQADKQRLYLIYKVFVPSVDRLLSDLIPETDITRRLLVGFGDGINHRMIRRILRTTNTDILVGLFNLTPFRAEGMFCDFLYPEGEVLSQSLCP